MNMKMRGLLGNCQSLNYFHILIIKKGRNLGFLKKKKLYFFKKQSELKWSSLNSATENLLCVVNFKEMMF